MDFERGRNPDWTIVWASLVLLGATLAYAAGMCL
jgi:hypothetical protein